MSVTKTILVQARDKIKDPAHRTTGTFAKDKNGKPVVAWDKNATCWCTVGALNAVALAPKGRAYKEAICEASKALRVLNKVAPDVEGITALKGLHPAVYINDHGTHEQVMKMFELAIAEAS